MGIRLIATDLDGTLLDEHSNVPEGTLEELRRVMRLGVRVAICSGRSPASTLPFAQTIGLNAPYVTSNGAQIVDEHTHQVLDAVYFTRDQALKCARFAQARGLHIQAYDDTGFYCAQMCPLSASYAASTRMTARATGTRLSDCLTLPCAKLIMIMPEAVSARVLPEAERELAGAASVTASAGWMIEFEPPGVNKATGLERLARRLGIAREDIVAFGDAMNDCAMLRWAGTGVAMENARQEVRLAADEVCPSNTREGVATWLREHISKHIS